MLGLAFVGPCLRDTAEAVEAEKAAREALRLQPTLPVANYHLVVRFCYRDAMTKPASLSSAKRNSQARRTGFWSGTGLLWPRQL